MCPIPFVGHCDLDIVSRIIMSGAYLLYYLMYESQIWCVDSYWDGGVVHTILGHFYLNIDFWPHSRFLCLEHISYITTKGSAVAQW